MSHSDSQGILAPLLQSQSQFVSLTANWAQPPSKVCSAAFWKIISTVLSDVQGDEYQVTNVLPAWVESWEVYYISS